MYGETVTQKLLIWFV